MRLIEGEVYLEPIEEQLEASGARIFLISKFKGMN
jgi:hypothetical protein